MLKTKGNRVIDKPSFYSQVIDGSESPQISLDVFYLAQGKIINSVTYKSINYSTKANISMVMGGSTVIEGNYIKFNIISGLQQDRYLIEIIVELEGGYIYNTKKMIRVT